jgi:hypothetical protein
LNIRKGIERFLPAQLCVLCGTMSHDGLWCGPCDQALPYLDTPLCPTCALPTPAGEICGQCLKHPPMFKNTVAVFGYSFPLDKLIQAMKYGEQLSLANAFAKRLKLCIDKHALPDYLIPMPLHPVKLRERASINLCCLPQRSRVITISSCFPTHAGAYAIRLRNPPCHGKSAKKTCVMLFAAIST